MLEDSEKAVAKERDDLLAHRRFLEEEVVAAIRGDTFDLTLRFGEFVTKVSEWYAAINGHSKITVPEIGEVSLDRRAVGNSRGHGSNPNRLVAFEIVPVVLRRGRVIHSEPMRGNPRGTFFHVAAPVRIGATDFIAVVHVKQDKQSTRLYVHQVFQRQKLQRTPSIGLEEQVSGQSVAGAAETVLRRIYSVKET